MIKYFASSILILFLSNEIKAQTTVNWADDIACIVYTHCGRCHNNENSLAAFPLISYQQMFGQRTAMMIYTQNMSMPPYLPITKHTRFAEEKNLTTEEIALIKDWVNSGAVQGDSTHAPTPPVFNISAGILTSPDVSVKIPTYVVPNTAVNFRQVFVLTPPLSSSKNIEAIEIAPGNPSAVYSVYVYADTSSTPLQLDNADAALGYTHFGGIGSNSAKPIFGWVPGSEPFYFPQGFGLHIDSGSRYIVQVEYAEDAGGKTDSTLLNIRYGSPSVREFRSLPLLSHNINLINGPLFIKADSVVSFEEIYNVTSDITLLSISPMLHNICKGFHVYSVSALNDTTDIIEIGNWNTVWSQGVYVFQYPLHIMSGSTLHAIAHFDNRFSNLNNPNNPLQNINAGVNENNEEMIFYFESTPYQIGDELIVMDTAPHMNHYLNCSPLHSPVNINEIIIHESLVSIYPNPTNNIVNINANEINSITIYNTLGEIIFSENKINTNELQINTSQWSKGIYSIQVNTKVKLINKKLIVN